MTSTGTDEDTLAYELWEFTEKMLSDNAYDHQIAYLRGTKKPYSLSRNGNNQGYKFLLQLHWAKCNSTIH